MADVRLTAVNPEDSQVYPVACNDKGELLLDPGTSPSGDLDVPGNLTVAGNGDFAGGVTINGPSGAYKLAVYDDTLQARFQDSDGTSQITYFGNVSGETVIRSRNNVNYGPIVFQGFNGTQDFEYCRLNSDGSASFGGRVDVINQLFAAQSSPVGGNPGNSFIVKDTRLNKIASLIYTDGTQRIGGNLTGGWSTDAPNIALNSDGSASLSGQLTVDRNLGSGNNGACIRVEDGGSLVSRLNNDGSATFNGNVTAPNINFKLAPTTVAAMPAPLIDEGFAANDEVDLLSVIIEMKLQIRDLNAFMQRSIQDDPAT